MSEKDDYTLPVMVEKESKEADLVEAQQVITSARMERGKNGRWTLILDANGDVEIDGDRFACFRGELRISGTQRGRRPNPSWGRKRSLSKMQQS